VWGNHQCGTHSFTNEVLSMKRSMFGVLALVAGMSACKGDPTSSLRDEVVGVVSDPTSLFIAQGDSAAVIVSAVDGQGNALDVSDLTFQADASIIGVADDPTYLAVNTGTQLQQSRRLFVKGLSPASTPLTVSTNGKSLDIPVRVTPTSVAATFSNAAPAANELITITLPAGFKFGVGAAVSSALTGPGIIEAISADSTSADVLLAPATTGSLTIDSVTVDFAPGVKFSLPTTDTVAVGALTPAPGTGSPSTAPSLTVPPLDGTTGFFDIGTFTAPDLSTDGGVAAQYYKFTITEDGDYTFTTNWDNTSDIDMEICSDTSCSDGGMFIGTGIDQPETALVTLTAGVYYFDAVLFAGAPPGSISIKIQHTATPSAP
jgi:hypothetical protein